MKINLYFVFYIAMIMELLIFIVDRDEAEGKLSKINEEMSESLAESFAEPLVLCAPDTINVQRMMKTNEVFAVLGLSTPKERASVQYVVDGGSPDFIRLDSTTGNAILSHRFEKSMTLLVSCTVARDIPSYIPSPAREAIAEKLGAALGEAMIVKSNAVQVHIRLVGGKAIERSEKLPHPQFEDIGE